MDAREKSVPVRILAARFTVRLTVRCNCHARPRLKYSGMFEKADIVNADHHRHGDNRSAPYTARAAGRAVLAHLPGQIESQPEKRVRRDTPRPDTGRHVTARFFRRDIRDKFAIAVLPAKGVQKAPNVNLVTGEVAADGMSINGKAHEQHQYSGA